MIVDLSASEVGEAVRRYASEKYGFGKYPVVFVTDGNATRHEPMAVVSDIESLTPENARLYGIAE